MLALKGHQFETTSLAESPFTSSLVLNKTTGSYDAKGSFPDLLNILSQIMNFTYRIDPPPDKAWGGLQSNGSWNGMMHLVQQNLKDFGT